MNERRGKSPEKNRRRNLPKLIRKNQLETQRNHKQNTNKINSACAIGKTPLRAVARKKIAKKFYPPNSLGGEIYRLRQKHPKSDLKNQKHNKISSKRIKTSSKNHAEISPKKIAPPRR